MLQTDRKSYEAPTLQELGVMKDITEQGNVPNADSPNGLDGTAYVPGSWFRIIVLTKAAPRMPLPVACGFVAYHKIITMKFL